MCPADVGGLHGWLGEVFLVFSIVPFFSAKRWKGVWRRVSVIEEVVNSI